MARFLGLDWDQNQLHILQGSSVRGGIRLERAALFLEANPLKVAQAEAAGKLLRQHLKTEGIEPAPVLACVARERVVVKVIRIPQVAANEEPGLVRFQAAKELTEPDHVVIDYFIRDGANGERKAFVIALRKDVVNFYQTMCKAAGLKLLTLTPRAFGVAAALQHAAAKPGPETTVAVAALSPHWAEFFIVRGEQILYSRPMTVGVGLQGEIRRNLATYGNLAGSDERDKVLALYVAGGEEHPELREALEQAAAMPVYPLDPFAGQEKLKFADGPRGGFAPLAGLLAQWGAHGRATINLVKPREPQAVSDPNGRMKVLLAGLGVVALLAFVLLANFVISDRSEEEQRLRAQNSKLDKELATLAPEAKQIEALKTWNNTSVSWLDEMYDLTALFPEKSGLHVKELNGVLKERAPVKGNVKNAPKETYFAALDVIGEVPSNDDRLIDALKEQLKVKDKRRAAVKSLPATEKKNVKDFSLLVDLGLSPNDNYNLVLRQSPRSSKVAQEVVPAPDGWQQLSDALWPESKIAQLPVVPPPALTPHDPVVENEEGKP